MKTYLYRAVATEDVPPEAKWESGIGRGETLGRMSGYLSRSSAVDAGESSGVSYRIIRSKPVDFTQGTSKHDNLVTALVGLVADGVTGNAPKVIAKEIQRRGGGQ